MSTQTLHRGYPDYTLPATVIEKTGKDISAMPVKIMLWPSPTEPPSVTDAGWSSGVVTRPSSFTVTVKLLVDDSVPLGRYYVWVKLTDSPSIVPLVIRDRSGQLLTIDVAA